MTCCLINGLALVAEEQTHHSFQYQHATTLPKQYSSESCRTTQAQSNYDWLSHQRACHSNGGRNTFIMDFRINMQQVRTVGGCHAGQQKACLSSRRTNNISAQLSVRCDVATNLFSKGVLLENRSLFVPLMTPCSQKPLRVVTQKYSSTPSGMTKSARNFVRTKD